MLACAQGVDNTLVAARRRVKSGTVSTWGARFVEQRRNGMLAASTRTPHGIDDARVDEVIARALDSIPDRSRPLEDLSKPSGDIRTFVMSTGPVPIASGHFCYASTRYPT